MMANVNEQKPQKYRLVPVAFVVQNCEWNNEEDENGINDIDNKTDLLQVEVTVTVVDRVSTGLTVGDIGWKYQDGDGGNGEAQNNYEVEKIGLVRIVGMLVVDKKKVDIENEKGCASHTSNLFELPSRLFVADFTS